MKVRRALALFSLPVLNHRHRAFTNVGSMLVAALLCATSMGTVLASGGGHGESGIPAAFQTPGIVSVTLSPSSISGGSGGTSTGTVTLNGPAPAGGAVVTLASSNLELAATMPSVTVPEGASSATFVVGTNAGYRRYSNLSFSAVISATLFASSRSATLNVTAQPRPPDFNSGSTAGANTQWDGLMCGGLAPIGGYQGILYTCSPPDASGFGSCTFQQECSLGCRRVPPSGSRFNDFCATSGPNSVAISDNYVVSGDRVPASIVLEAPAGNAQDQEQGSPAVLSLGYNAAVFPHSSFSIPDGATSFPFAVGTSYVPAIEFADVTGFWFNASIPPFLITNGRAGHAWLVMIPPDPPPAVALPTLGDFFISGLNPIIGGESTFGQADLSGISRAGGPTLTLTSSHPSIVPSKTITAPQTENFLGFQVFFETNPTATDTDVTVTLSDGRYSFSDVLTVRARPPDPVLAGVSVNPTSVVGGTSSIGTVTLSAPQSSATVVQVSMIDGAPASFTSNNPPCPPSSRCQNVTVPAGATSANFTINTSPVTSQFNLNIYADLPGSPGRQTLLLITAGGAVTIGSAAINPTSMVGGASATGTVTLTGAAPSSGAVVTLSKAFSGSGSGTVPVTIPASVTVPSGQTTASFTINSSAVTAATNVRISGTYNGSTANADTTLFPLLNSVMFDNNLVPGGTPAPGAVFLNGPAPAGGTVVTLASANTSLVTVPASVTVPAGQTSVSFTANTSPVTQTTTVGITGSAQGTTVQANLFLTVSRAVESVTLNPSSVVGPASVTGTVTLRATSNGNLVVDLASSNTVLATVPFSVIVPSGQRSATFTVNAAQVTQTSTVAISATHENVTRSATLTINPSGGSGGPTLSAVSVNPASVTGGDSSTGTVTLTSAAPSGGLAVSLADNSVSASSPSSVTVPAGATSATFTINTVSVATTSIATLTATAGSTSRTADLTITAAGGGGGAPGFLSPTVNAPDSGGDGNGFQSSPVSAHADDAAVATDTNSGSGTSTSCTNTGKDRHRFYDFGFAIPGGSAIAGIEVRLDARADSTSGTPRMCVQLSWDAGVTWTSAKTTATLGTSLATFTLGGATDTWGRTWSAANLTNANFRLRVINVAASTSRDFFLDWVAVRPHIGTAAPAALSAVSVSPTSVTGGTGATGTATLTSGAPSGGAVVSLTSSNTAVATVPASVTVAQGATSTTFAVTTASVASSTAVTITAVYLGVTRTTTLTVTPVPPAASLQSVSMNPASVTGGATSQGTVTLSSGAPAGGAVVSLSSSNTAAATVPGSVTVAAGATTATFTATTVAVGTSTPVTISAVYSGVTRTATLTVAPPAAAATLTVTATGRTGERVTSSPAGINVLVGTTGSAPFNTGTSITLSVTNGRDAVWSGACSSGGNKTRTCTFTINANASVSANVQ